MKRIGPLCAAIGVAIGMGWVAQRWAEARPERSEWPIDPAILDSGAGLGLLLIGGWFFGRLFAAVRLPRLVGYLVFGMIVGPSALNAITRPSLEYLSLVNNLAIAMIALGAGGELQLGTVRRALKTVAITSCTQTIAILSLVTIAGYVALPRLGWVADLPPAHVALVALVIASASLAYSPAVLFAMLTELRAKGPFTNLSVAITVLQDFWLVVLFTSVVGFATTVLHADQIGIPFGGDAALSVGFHLIGSLAIGAVFGLAAGLVISRSGTPGPTLIILSCVGIASIAERLDLQLLLLALSAGMVLRNVWPKKTDHLFETLQWLSTPVYCVFFAVAGARLDLDAMATIWPVALGIAMIRCAGIWIGTRAGLAISREHAPWAPWLWTAFVPQAGVALALVMVVAEAFANLDFGLRIYTLLVAAIGINELIGPILLKLGFIRAGEVGPADPGSN